MLHPSRILPLLILLAAGGATPAAAQRQVVVYTSVDDVFARPIAEQFTRSTGIEVKLVPDPEETKSTGLLNRAIAEKSRPQPPWSPRSVSSWLCFGKVLETPRRADGVHVVEKGSHP